jgi:hypothetical protein
MHENIMVRHEIHIKGPAHTDWYYWAVYSSYLFAADTLRYLRDWRPRYAWRVVTFYPADLVSEDKNYDHS